MRLCVSEAVAAIVVVSFFLLYPSWPEYASSQHYRSEHVAHTSAANGTKHAIVSSLYDNSYGIALRVLAHSLDKANMHADKILLYLPTQVHIEVLLEVQQAGWQLWPVKRIDPPKAGVSHQFRDQFTKLRIWELVQYESVIYLDADTLVLRNFDELWSLPTAFAAVPDIYLDDRSWVLGINAGVMFVKPSVDTFNNLLRDIHTVVYEPSQAEQSFLREKYAYSVMRLPYIYNGNLAIKKKSAEVWKALEPDMAIIHYTLEKPFHRPEHEQQGKLFEQEFALWWNMKHDMKNR